MEMAIRELLQEAGESVSGNLDIMKDQTPTQQISPETYLGSARMRYYYPSGSLTNGTKDFILSNNLSQNTFSYGGTWNITDETAVAGENASINYNFIASKVFIILRPVTTVSSGGGKVKVYLDGKVINSANAGTDVQNGIVTVSNDKLFNIIDLHGKTENHTLKLEFQSPGVEAYTFTFG